MPIDADTLIAAAREFARINRIFEAYGDDLADEWDGPLPPLDGIEMVRGLTNYGSIRIARDKAVKDLLIAAVGLEDA